MAQRLAVICVMTVSLVHGGCSRSSSSDGTRRMATEPQFNRITRQLIDAPFSSNAILEQAQRDRPPLPPESSANAVVQARSWVQETLKEPYWPPAETPFIAIPLESDVCDVVRARYRIGATMIDVAQSHYILSIRVTDSESPPAIPVAQVEAVAGRMLSVPSVGVVETLVTTDRRTVGKLMIPLQPGADLEWPDWRQSLQWWSSGAEVGFIAIKLPGGPTREVIDDEEESNIRWFE
jgi:hypothetical protein